MTDNEKREKLYIVTQHYPYGNGEKTFLEPELRRLLETNKFDITIISNAVKGSKLTSDVNKDIKVVYIPLVSVKKRLFQCMKYGISYFLSESTKIERKELKNKGIVFGQLFESLFFYIQSEIFYHDLVKKNMPMKGVIIYTYWCNTQTLAFVLHKSELENIKIVSRIHGFDLYDERTMYGRQPFRRTIDNKLDRLYFIAQAGMEYYIKRMGNESKERYILSRLGTERTEACNENLRVDEGKLSFLLVSCSNVIPIKRIEMIILALAEIEEELTWVHFGDGIERENIMQKALEVLRNKENIQYEFRGQTDNKDILLFYREHLVNCFITTSQSEGCPVSIQEAMSFGVPIIATSVGEIPKMIIGNGILLTENPTPTEIADAIKKIYDMPLNDVYIMREKSRSLWEQYFNADRNYKSFAESLVDL